MAEAREEGPKRLYLGRGRHLHYTINVDAYLATGTAINRWHGNAGAANGDDSGG